MNKKGFTLIEIIAVIIIIGIIFIITIPAVSKYIFSSDRTAYASNVQAYLETMKGEYEMLEYGELLKDDEIMIVPMNNITLEKSDNGKSPYGLYDMDKSYFIITPERKGYSFYANVVDETGVGIKLKPSNELGKDVVLDDIGEEMENIEIYTSGSVSYQFKGINYEMCETRTVTKEDEVVDDSLKVYVLCDMSA